MTRAKPQCITARRDAHGYYWRYTYPPGEPDETLAAAIQVAAIVAGDKARESGRNYVVASTPQPAAAVFVLRARTPSSPPSP